MSCWNCGLDVNAPGGLSYHCTNCDVTFYDRSPWGKPNAAFTDPSYRGGAYVDFATTWMPCP